MDCNDNNDEKKKEKRRGRRRREKEVEEDVWESFMRYENLLLLVSRTVLCVITHRASLISIQNNICFIENE